MNPLRPTSHTPAPLPIPTTHTRNPDAQRRLRRAPAARARAGSGIALLLFILVSLLPAGVAAAPPVAELPSGCSELILNGSFEQINTAWFLPASLHPPVYDNSKAFAGSYSLRLGNLDMPNNVSVSRAEQTVALPINATSIILSFRYFGRTEDDLALGADDRQFLDIINPDHNELIVRQFEARNKERAWMGAQYSLTGYRGRTVRLSFGVQNDGDNARLAMNLDEVSLYYCTSTPTATPTSTPPWTPTFIPTAFPTAFPTPFPPPTFVPPSTLIPVYPTASPFPPDLGCTNVVVNGGFESDAGWTFGPNDIPGQPVWSFRNSGNRSAQLGNPPNFRPDQLSFSSMRQLVTIPANSPVVQLRWFNLLGTEEQQTDMVGAGVDRQDVVLLNPNLSTLAVVFRTRRNTNAFTQQLVDLSQYRGRSLYIYFNAFNDGNGRRTWMYVDDVQLCIDVQAVPFVAQPQAGYAAAGSAGTSGQTTVVQSGLGDGTQPQALLQPDYGQPATLTPWPTDYVSPDAQATADANAARTNFSDTAADAAQASATPTNTPEPTATSATVPATEQKGSRTSVTIAALCLIALVVGGLSIMILRAISRPRNPTP